MIIRGRLIPIFICTSLLLLATKQLGAQQIEWDLELSLTGLVSTEDELPFWMVANQDRQFGGMTNFAGLVDGQGRYYLEDYAFFEAGTAWYYRDQVATEFQRRDLYLSFQNRWLKIIAGSKKQDVQAQGLSASNKDFLRSGNARPLSGLLIEANNPLRISNTFGIDWGIGHYSLNDDRFVSDVWVHYKHLALITRFNEDHALSAKLTHYAQWAGNSPVFGDLPDDFSAFVDVFFARKATEDTGIDQENANAVGNHLGSYLLDYLGQFRSGLLNIYHEHPFEDGSGTRLANFPDGIWGIHWRWYEHPWLRGLLYEYIQTTDQSGGLGLGSGEDSYFSNSLYRSGWSYDQTIIGLPFILIDPDLEVTDMNRPIFSDRTRVHHFGLRGHFRAVEWLLKSSVATHLGRYQAPIEPELHVWSNYLMIDYNTGIYGNLILSLGLDTGNLISTNFGVGLTYRYRI